MHTPLIDAHSHAIEYNKEELDEYNKENIQITAVSENIETSNKTLLLAEKYENIKPCVGIHPWNIKNTPLSHLKELEKIVSKLDKPCIGEVGLDTYFVPETIERQRTFFKKIVVLAKEYNAILNLHTPGTWKEVLNLLIKNDIKKAMFHWYTGPQNLIDIIEENGYYISINVAAKIQKKQLNIIKKTSLHRMLTESDGPYRYKGIRLHSLMIKDLLNIIASIKNREIEDIKQTLFTNYRKLFYT